MAEEKVQEVILVDLEDVSALYIDSELVSIDGSYDLPFKIKGKTVKFRHRYRLDCDQNWIDNVGDFPETFDELLENEYQWEEDNREYVNE